MPFDEALAKRVRAHLRRTDSLIEKRMFGGLAFMVNGHMCCGVVGQILVVRTGPDEFEAALSQTHARPMDITGRPMRGFVYVDPPGYGSTGDLKNWIQRGPRSGSSFRRSVLIVALPSAHTCTIPPYVTPHDGDFRFQCVSS
jgi:hypothetical protein